MTIRQRLVAVDERFIDWLSIADYDDDNINNPFIVVSMVGKKLQMKGFATKDEAGEYVFELILDSRNATSHTTFDVKKKQILVPSLRLEPEPQSYGSSNR